MSNPFESTSIDDQINRLSSTSLTKLERDKRDSRAISTDSHDEQPILDDNFAPGTLLGHAGPSSQAPMGQISNVGMSTPTITGGSRSRNRRSVVNRNQSILSNSMRNDNNIASSNPNLNTISSFNNTISSSSFLENYGTTSFDLDSNLAVEVTGTSQNFHTIDWLRELSRSRQRHWQGRLVGNWAKVFFQKF